MTWNPAGLPMRHAEAPRARWTSIAIVVPILAAAAASGLTGVAVAADEIGLFFDSGATKPCEQAGTFATLSTYLILLEPSCGGKVCGWECLVSYDNATFIGCSLMGQNMNLATPPEFEVGVPDGLPTASAIVLAQLSFLTSGGGPVRFYIERYSQSFVDTPQYADCAETPNLYAMTPRTLAGSTAVAGVNTPECTPQSATWGQVKSTFQ